ncbi:MAG: bifunctional nuclease family protein [candidate division KSB1 bacterium]|nr:bifunctional nuclease family protein [candidate division KSB1 bacterium]
MLVAVKVERVTLDTSTNRFVVILKDEVHGRWLPIVVGSTEAQAIALQLEKITPPRPLTHDLMKNLLSTLDVQVTRVIVNDLRENTYYALISLKVNGDQKEIDARPSDAIALALRMHAPIFVDEEVMRKAAVVEQREQPEMHHVTEEEHEEKEEELSLADKLEQLNVELRKAIRDERYEDAARLRDQINELRKLREKQE